MANIEPVGVEAVVKGYAAFLTKLGQMDSAINGVGLAGKGAAAGLGVFSLALGALVAGALVVGAAIAGAAVGIGILGKESIETAISVESAFAGVLKSTNTLGTNLFDLTETGKQVFQQFRDLAKEVPLSLEELSKIGMLGGQLGIAEDQLAGFTETVAALSFSADSLSLEEAALGLSRFGIVMSKTGDVTADAFERIASTIVYAGNNLGVLESEVLLTARNIAQTASLTTATEADVLGLATAIAKAGITAEAGGSAIQGTMAKIIKAVALGGDSLDLFASVAGLSADEFAALWKEDATEAFVQFVEGLQEQGEDAIIALDELGLADRRVTRTLLGISKAGVDLRDILEQTNTAYEENTALTREAQIRYATFESQLEITKNKFRDMALTIGLELLPIFGDLLENLGPLIDAIAEGLGPAAETVGDAIRDKFLPALERLFDILGIEINLEDITQGIIDFGDAIADKIESFSNFVDEFGEFVDLLKTEGLKDALLSLGIPTEVAQSIDDTATSFKSLNTKVQEFLEDQGAKWQQWLIDNHPLIEQAGLQIGLFLIDKFIGLNNTIQDTNEDLEGFLGVLDSVITWLLNVATGVLALFTGHWQLAFDTALKSTTDILNSIEEKLRYFTDVVFPEFFNILFGPQDEEGNARLSPIEQIIEGWKLGVEEKTAEITEIIVNWISGLPNTILEWEDNFFNAGQSLIKGLWDGIEKFFKNVLLPGLERLVKQALDLINLVTGTHSPSTEFAKIGKNWMAGLMKGIEDNISGPEKALVMASDRVMGVSPQTLPSSVVNNSGSVDQSFNPVVNANYYRTQAPNTILDDLAMVAALG